MSINQRQLAASLLAAAHIADRHAIAAFVADAGTQVAPNPFAETSAGTVRQVWRQRAAEFRSFDIEAIGLNCLLTAVSGMEVHDALVQEIFRAGPHTANVFHRGDGCRIVGAVLYGKAGAGLPQLPIAGSTRAARGPCAGALEQAAQFDLFVRA